MTSQEKKIRELHKKVMQLQINGKYAQANRLSKRIELLRKGSK